MKESARIEGLESALRALAARVQILEAAEQARAGGRDRQRRARDRRTNGQRRFSFWADEITLTDKLVAGGFLDALMADYPARENEALQRMMDAMAPVTRQRP